MSDDFLFEVFVHTLSVLLPSNKIIGPNFHFSLADFEPFHICSGSGTATSHTSAEIITVAAGKSCNFTDAPVSEPGFAEAPCTISLSSGCSTDGRILGTARLCVCTTPAQFHGLCPIWQHRPRALPLYSPATGAQTAVVCISVRLIQQMQSGASVGPRGCAEKSEARSQDSVPSGDTSASWGSSLSQLSTRDNSTCTSSTQARYDVKAWQQSHHTHTDTHQMHNRPDVRRHTHPLSIQAPSNGMLKKNDAAEEAWQHDGSHLTHDLSVSSQQPHETAKRSCQHPQHNMPSGAGRGFHDKKLSSDSVIVSKQILKDLMKDLGKGFADIEQLRHDALTAHVLVTPSEQQPTLQHIQHDGHSGKEMLRALMEDLAKGLADIAQLRHEVMTGHVQLTSCDQPSLRPIQHDKPSMPHCRSSETGPHRQQQRQASHLQDMHGSLASRRRARDTNSGRDGYTEQCQKALGKGRTPEATGSKAGEGSKSKQNEHTYAQPTGHPMVTWRTNLRSEKPLQGQRDSQPVPYAHWKTDKGSIINAGVAVASHGRRRKADMHPDAQPGQQECSVLGTAEHKLPDAGRHEDHPFKHEHSDQDPSRKQLPQVDTRETQQANLSAAELSQKQQHEAPESSPAPCELLKQRYLPMYSVFDEGDAAAAWDTGDHAMPWNAGHDSPQGVHSASGTAGSLGQRAHEQHRHTRALHGNSRAGNPNEGLHIDVVIASPEAQATKGVHVEEDQLRAALSAFARRVS